MPPDPSTIPSPGLASTLPVDDVLALGSLVDFRQTRTWARNRIAQYKKHIAALVAICNSIAPINTLPNELLMKIFTTIPGLSWDNAE